MRAKSYLAAIAVLGLAVWFATDPNRRASLSNESPRKLRNVGDSVESEWRALSLKIRNINADSSREDLEQARSEVVRDLDQAKVNASAEYEACKAQLARLDAASRLKDARERLDQLKKSEQRVAQTADQASKTMVDLKERADEAEQAYENAQAKAAEYFQ